MCRAAEDSVFAKQHKERRTPPSAASLPGSLSSACLDSRICLSIHQPGYFLDFQRLKAVRKRGLQSHARRSGRAFAVHLFPHSGPADADLSPSPRQCCQQSSSPTCPFPKDARSTPLSGSPSVRLVQTTPYRGPRPAEERGKEETGKEDSNAAISKRRKEEAEKVKNNQRGMRNINSYHLTSTGLASQFKICANLLQG